MRTLGIILGSLALWFLGWEYFDAVWGSSNQDQKIAYEISGAFGDSFGVVTAISSGIAAYLVFLTLRTQRQELKETRDELMMTRVQQERQAVESTIFSLIQQHKENVSSRVIQNLSGNKIQGESGFGGLVSSMDKLLESKCKELSTQVAISQSISNGAYDYSIGLALLQEHQQKLVIEYLYSEISYYVLELNSYLKHLVLMLDYLSDSYEILGDKKEIMDRAVTAGISDYEVLVLYYLRNLMDEDSKRTLYESPIFDGYPKDLLLFDPSLLKFPLDTIRSTLADIHDSKLLSKDHEDSPPES